MIATLPDRTAWLAERQGGVGGSDAAAALGKSPWKSRFQLWSEKVGLVEPPDLSENEAVEWGLRLEGPIAIAYRERSGRRVEIEPRYTIRHHAEYDWLLASLDATQEAEDKPGVGTLQIKTASAWNDDDWKDEPPPYYQIQLQHEMAAAGLQWGTLCVLIGGQKMRWFDQPRNETFIEAMIDQEQAFWLLVKSETAPEVDGSEETARILKALYPIDNGESVALPDDAAEWDTTLQGVVSLLGWGLLLKGALFIVAPRFVEKGGAWEVKSKLVPVAGAALLIIGAYLTSIAYLG